MEDPTNKYQKEFAKVKWSAIPTLFVKIWNEPKKLKMLGKYNYIYTLLKSHGQARSQILYLCLADVACNSRSE